ncbi:MAG: phosphoribosyltransferase [Candidatus Accumulibacter sp.]|uniref:Phosphoribosyltransferase n=1 Tax=Candidatus Accumulibacter proximus TaxID=2954385 RepID=A0A935UF27_9PROT|nr:phosphoribosyltransferase [Candidatus Accumulibacter proximus]
MSELVQLTWSDIDRINHHLALSITKDQYRPELIVAIARGGLVCGAHLGYVLSVRHIDVVSIQRTSDDGPCDHTGCTPVLTSTLSSESRIEGKRILVVDGAIGTGRTLRLCINVVQQHRPLEVRAAVGAIWAGCPNACALHTLPVTSYFGGSYHPWPVFPWEV